MEIINKNKLLEEINDLKIKILNKSQFLGHLFYNIEIKITNKIDTLAVYFNNNKLKFFMLINPLFFNKLKNTEKIAVIEHELYHIYFRHFDRIQKIQNINWEIANIAMDISINQYIENLPKGALFPETYNLEKNLNFEEYYYLLNKKNPNEINKNDGNDINDNNNQNKNINNEEKNNNTSLDNHKWFEKIYKNENNDDNDKNDINDNNNKNKNMNNEIFESYIKNLFNEILNKIKIHEKTFLNKGKTDKIIEEEIEEYLKKLKKTKTLNIKYLIKLWIEKIILTNFFKTSWKYPNRRFDEIKGKKRIKKRKFAVAIDTSYSISENELEYFLNIIYNTVDKLYDEVLLLLFNSNVYWTIKINKKFKIKKVIENIEMGGTNIQKVFDYLKKYKYKKLIILTDGETSYPLKTYNIKTIWIYNNLNELIKNNKYFITSGIIINKNPFKENNNN